MFKMSKLCSLNFRFRGHFQNCHIDWIPPEALRQINFPLLKARERTNEQASELSIVTDVKSLEIAHGLGLNSSIYKCKWCRKNTKLLFAELKFFENICYIIRCLTSFPLMRDIESEARDGIACVRTMFGVRCRWCRIRNSWTLNNLNCTINVSVYTAEQLIHV